MEEDKTTFLLIGTEVSLFTTKLVPPSLYGSELNLCRVRAYLDWKGVNYQRSRLVSMTCSSNNRI
jgi:hypothetical protein